MITREELGARLKALETRLTKTERDMQAFQLGMVQKVSEVLGLIQKQLDIRDAKLNHALKKVAAELANLKKSLEPTERRLTH